MSDSGIFNAQIKRLPEEAFLQETRNTTQSLATFVLHTHIDNAIGIYT